MALTPYERLKRHRKERRKVAIELPAVVRDKLQFVSDCYHVSYAQLIDDFASYHILEIAKQRRKLEAAQESTP